MGSITSNFFYNLNDYFRNAIMNSIQSFIQFLQSCITPVALISGVGLILLSLTNRLGRTIDRSRMLVVELEKR
ncbi:MAG: DUF2721 domain-containing protein [Bacteroidales bacterium]|nr:DUF2721 domain-containing protein [Bacteroidales bacterium]